MTMTFIFHSHSISRWWMGLRIPAAATLGLVFLPDILLQCSSHQSASRSICASLQNIQHINTQSTASVHLGVLKKDVTSVCVLCPIVLSTRSLLRACLSSIQRGKTVCAHMHDGFICVHRMCFMCSFLSLAPEGFNTSGCSVFKETFM